MLPAEPPPTFDPRSPPVRARREAIRRRRERVSVLALIRAAVLVGAAAAVLAYSPVVAPLLARTGLLAPLTGGFDLLRELAAPLPALVALVDLARSYCLWLVAALALCLPFVVLFRLIRGLFWDPWDRRERRATLAALARVRAEQADRGGPPGPP